MSHFKQSSPRKQRAYMALMIGGVFVFLFSCMEIFMQRAYAATVTPPPLKSSTHSTNPSYLLKSDLANLTRVNTATLDWRQPSVDLFFDLPAHDWYDTLDLFITATPNRAVSRRTPLLVKFNGGDAIPLVARGQKFDAHIRLQPSQIRNRNNKLTISYQTPSDVDCLNASHGQWQIDMAGSKLVAKARAKRRPMTINDMAKRIQHPMTSPRRIALIATGVEKTSLEALGAMAMAQRTQNLPQFSLSAGPSDFNLIMGTYSEIRHKVRDKNKLKGHSAVLFIDKSTRPTLVISGPTTEKVVDLARSFAQKKLPRIKRSSLNIFDLQGTESLQPPVLLEQQPQSLTSLGAKQLVPSWHTSSTNIMFNAAGAHSNTGELILKVNSNYNKTAQSGKLGVYLNGQSLGYTPLDKMSKRVSFDIKPGQLMPSNNNLEIVPTFQNVDGRKTTKTSACHINNDIPSVSLGENSFITMTQNTPSPLNQLNNFSANGAPFSGHNGRSRIILSATSQRDKIASLNFLGFAARTIGANWSQAKFANSLPDLALVDENILLIGPKLDHKNPVLRSAPESLLNALSGKPAQGQNLRMANFHRQANLSSAQSFKISARSKAVDKQTKSGGVIALYPSPVHKGKMIGIISNQTQHGFHRDMAQLSTVSHWNALQGSVSRWNKNTVLMTQITRPLPAGFITDKPKANLLTTIKMLPTIFEKRLDIFLLTHEIPEIKLPKLSMPFFIRKEKPKVVLVNNNFVPIQLPTRLAALDNGNSKELIRGSAKFTQPSTVLPRLKPVLPVAPQSMLRANSSLVENGVLNQALSTSSALTFPTISSAVGKTVWHRNLPQILSSKWHKARFTMRTWRLEVRPTRIALEKKINGLLQNRLLLLGAFALIGFLLMGTIRPKAVAGQKG